MCQQGAFTPIGNPEVKEHAVPLQSQPVLKSVYTNRENGVCIYTFQNEKIPTVDPLVRRGKTVGIFYAAFIGTGETHASHTAAAVLILDTIQCYSGAKRPTQQNAAEDDR